MKKNLVIICATCFLALTCRQADPDRIEILVSPKAVSATFWLTVKAGADEAARETGCTVYWKGPAAETGIATQIAILEDYIHKDIDAIVFAACDANALIPVAQKAVEAGIPVITIDSGLHSDLPVVSISTDNHLGGRQAADILAELSGGAGKVACIPIVPGAATSIERETGFKSGLTQYPGLKLAATQYNQGDIAMAMTVTENILTAHSDLTGLFAASESGTIGAVQGLISKGLAGKVKLVGFDSAPNEIRALKEGFIHALIVQNPFQMGYLGVKTALEVLNGKPVQKTINTGVTVVTLKNLHSPEIQMLINPQD